jgi:glutathione S-transferase
MSLPPFLTDEEIERLTKPLTQGAARCRYLEREYKVLVRRDPNGQPIVGRAEFEAALMAQGRGAAPAANDGNVVSVDFDALSQVKKKRVGSVVS